MRRERRRRVHVRVAVDAPESQELRILEAGDHLEHALLLGDPQPRLEADDVPHPSRAVLAPELHHRVGPTPRARVVESHGLHRAEAERLAPTTRHLLDGHAPLEVRDLVELVARELIGHRQGVDERFVFRLVHRAVQIRAAVVGPFHRLLAVPRGAEDNRVIERLLRHDRRDGIVEGERLHSESLANGRRKPVAGEGAGRDDARRWKLGDLLAHHGDVRVRQDPIVHRRAEQVAVHRERAAGRDARFIGRRQDDRTERAHLGLEQPVRVGDLGALEGVRAHQLGELVGLMCLRAAYPAHLVQHHPVATLGELPGGLASGEPASDDMDFLRRAHVADDSAPTSRAPRVRRKSEAGGRAVAPSGGRRSRRPLGTS